ncbi:MAG: efflux RND transporter periplasmic adaptor subunit [Tannerellaceae bacterium]|jgi:Cu(I)/Ag(I) efflux system membrane fusion protein|nr:efflux RND transporter periplasmic adaptor subunit [Tannerellaceae bacterium]
MKTRNIRNALLFVSGGVIAGIIAGWWIFRHSPETLEEHSHTLTAEEAQVWTCSMHPQIRQSKPGKCPLCAMDLIPLKTAGTIDEAASPESIVLSAEAVALANIRTTPVRRSKPVKEIRLYGNIQPDERLVQSLVAHTGGRIERLFVSFTGETIRRGQKVATLYSPELLNAQQELLEAAHIQSPQSPALLEAAREKLRLLKLTDAQIAAIEQSQQTAPLIDIIAHTEGIVTAKKVSQGDYVNPGSVLFELTDLSTVWAMFDAYEADLPYLKPGNKLSYTLQALPGRNYQGRIVFIDPSLDKTTRTAKVRVETANPGLMLKPEMYAQAVVEASLDGQENSLIVPKTAVLWTGKRSILYVKQPEVSTPIFALREVELGPSLGDSYIILHGIEEGEEIVTSGTFAVDAGAQLEGKRSMMNNDTSSAAEGAHATLAVQGLCEMCKERIEQTAKGIQGVAVASWDMETKQLHIVYHPAQTSPPAVAQAVAKAGHDTDTYKADNVTYNALPDCCKYR